VKIKICKQNESKITEAIRQINVKAFAHTADMENIADLATEMEYHLNNFSIAIEDRSSAIAWGMSGGNVPNAYKYSRIVNTYKIKRGASAWFLIDVRRVEIYGNAYKNRLSLTPAQRDIAVTKFVSKFSVQPVVEAVAA